MNQPLPDKRDTGRRSPEPAQPARGGAVNSTWYVPIFRLLNEGDLEVLRCGGGDVGAFRRQRARTFRRYLDAIENRIHQLQVKRLDQDAISDVLLDKVSITLLCAELRLISYGYQFGWNSANRHARESLRLLVEVMKTPTPVISPANA